MRSRPPRREVRVAATKTLFRRKHVWFLAAAEEGPGGESAAASRRVRAQSDRARLPSPEARSERSEDERSPSPNEVSGEGFEPEKAMPQRTKSVRKRKRPEERKCASEKVRVVGLGKAESRRAQRRVPPEVKRSGGNESLGLPPCSPQGHKVCLTCLRKRAYG